MRASCGLVLVFARTLLLLAWPNQSVVLPPALPFGGPGKGPSSLQQQQQLPHSSFLEHVYEAEKDKDGGKYFLIRQVPGDGGCLFHATTVCLDYLFTNEHRDFDAQLRKVSMKLRRLAVQLLKRENDTLVMDNNEVISSVQLLEIVAEHYNMTPHDYCQKMTQPRTWGGGPEIVVISNHLKRPIHVYELCGAVGGGQKEDCLGQHKLKICAKFGSPRFDKNAPPLHILCADGRFPNIKPGKHKHVGDHFLALFPCDKIGCISLLPPQPRKETWWNDLGEGVEARERLRGGFSTFTDFTSNQSE